MFINNQQNLSKFVIVLLFKLTMPNTSKVTAFSAIKTVSDRKNDYNEKTISE